MDPTTFIIGILTVIYILLIIGTFYAILTEDTNPTKTMAWLLVLLAVPAVGLILYYVFGYNPRRKQDSPTKYELFKMDFSSKMPQEYEKDFDTHKDEVDPQYNTLVELLERSKNSQVWYGSDVEIITTGKRKFEALIEDLKNAKHHIHLEYFCFKNDKTGKIIKKILMQKAREGVEVRFIYENIANITINPRFYYDMRKAGVEVLAFSKASLSWIRRKLNNRDHRKIVVIDGMIGYTGGMNIGDEYHYIWRDTHMRIIGKGVYGLQYNFMHIWFESEGSLPDNLAPYFPPHKEYTDNLLQIVPETPTSKWPYLLLASANIVGRANRYIYIQTPYYLPPDPLLQTLKAAALGGVDVRVMVPQKADMAFMNPAIHSYYEECLLAGIRIYEYTKTFLHSKTMVVDDYVSVIGSTNMDLRSMEINFEINTYLYDPKIAKQNYDIFMEDMKNCREVNLDEWLDRPWIKRVIQSIMRLFSPVL